MNCISKDEIELQRKANAYSSPATFYAGYEYGLSLRGLVSIKSQDKRIAQLEQQISEQQRTIRMQQNLINDYQEEKKRVFIENVKTMPLKEYIATIEPVICDGLNIPIERLKERTRIRQVTYARCFIWYLVYSNYKISYRDLGNLYGTFDHTTVIHGIRTAKNLIETDIRYNSLVSQLITIKNQ